MHVLTVRVRKWHLGIQFFLFFCSPFLYIFFSCECYVLPCSPLYKFYSYFLVILFNVCICNSTLLFFFTLFYIFSNIICYVYCGYCVPSTSFFMSVCLFHLKCNPNLCVLKLVVFVFCFLSLHAFLSVPIYLSIKLYLILSIFLSVCMSILLSLFMYLPLHLFIYFSSRCFSPIFLPFITSVYASVHSFPFTTSLFLLSQETEGKKCTR